MSTSVIYSFTVYRNLQQHENDKQLKQINAGPRIFV
jgi:hypothetical protein